MLPRAVICLADRADPRPGELHQLVRREDHLGLLIGVGVFSMHCSLVARELKNELSDTIVHYYIYNVKYRRKVFCPYNVTIISRKN